MIDRVLYSSDRIEAYGSWILSMLSLGAWSHRVTICRSTRRILIEQRAWWRWYRAGFPFEAFCGIEFDYSQPGGGAASCEEDKVNEAYWVFLHDIREPDVFPLCEFAGITGLPPLWFQWLTRWLPGAREVYAEGPEQRARLFTSTLSDWMDAPVKWRL